MPSTRRDFLAGGAVLPALRVEGPAVEPQAAALKIGVVNVRTCFEKDRYARMAEALEELGKFRDGLEAEARALQQKVEKLSGEISAASPKGDIYVDKLRARTHAEYDLKLLQEVARRKLRERVTDLETRVYADLRRVIAHIARAQNLDLVLRVDEARLQEDAEVQRNASRDVLFHADGLDLTAQVLVRLNADWAKAWVCPTCRRKVADERCIDDGAKRPD